MTKIRISDKGAKYIDDCDKDNQSGIYPNHIFLLSKIRDGKWYDETTLKNQLRLVDWSECVHILSRNTLIECEA